MARDPRVEPKEKDVVQGGDGMRYLVHDRRPRTVLAITEPGGFCLKYTLADWRKGMAAATIVHVAEG